MTTHHTPLKRAIFDSGRRQIEIAKKAGIDETLLSRIANGHRPATDEQKAALARVLRKSVDHLFPGVAA